MENALGAIASSIPLSSSSSSSSFAAATFVSRSRISLPGGRRPRMMLMRSIDARVSTDAVSSGASPGDDRLPGIYDMVMVGKTKPRWQRVLLKVSGEALAGDGTQNIDPKLTMSIAREIASMSRLGIEVTAVNWFSRFQFPRNSLILFVCIQIAMVVGGGNFFRGANWAGASGLDRASADHIGMMATVMNAIFLQASLESVGVPTRVQTAYRMAEVAEPYIRRRAMRHLEKGRVVIFGAGTGNPFFTTDTAAALRAAEINAQVVLKATNVEGVYDCDPRKNSCARLLDHVSYRQVAAMGLNVMDLTAITLCQENSIPVVVFDLNKPGNISKALSGDRIGTLVDHIGSSVVSELDRLSDLQQVT
ncbi:uncharacterized protein LOC9644102 isoform X1 [Selaginella moellendorffii]|uniref:uncharacterized protein LOC9644102 isoform X1 n=1 Tax=Selaginella moellendorffii TaxID=88036 RepID=UPI000D1CB626|nr:uncharacterized protein LOC9644102 isoform X1 [Selaginella moellendorffii]|eukprot:XP_024521272.1 uncharacterized protein LOC9644102 isoform X1 [Selaginella moellendorffii]